MANPTKVMAGESVTYTTYEGGEKVVRTVTVLPPCEHKDAGRWLCIQHDEGFRNQLEKDFHISDSCRLVWVCMYHGIEQP